MFDSKDLGPEVTGQLERFFDPGEKLLVAERVRRVTTPAEWIGLVCGVPLFGALGAVAGSLIARSIVEQKEAGTLGGHCRSDRGFLVITDRSLRLVKRGFRNAVGDEQARLPISWLRSLQADERGKKLHLSFSDGSSRGLVLANGRVIPYLNSLRPWVESSHQGRDRAGDRTVAATPDPRHGRGVLAVF